MGGWADHSGGDGGAAISQATGSPADPILLEACKWFAVQSYAGSARFDTGWTYDPETGTATADQDGALDARVSYVTDDLYDGQLNGAAHEALIGDRVLLMDAYADADQGIYTVTDVGSESSPWVLTRATDADDPGDAALDFRVALAGTVFMARTSRYALADNFASYYGWAIYPSGGFAAGYNAIVLSGKGLAVGEYAAADGYRATALGGGIALGTSAFAVQGRAAGSEAIAIGGATAEGTQAVAIGSGCSATADGAVAIGYNAQASEASAIAVGNNAIASAETAMAVGYSATAHGAGSMAVGLSATAHGAGSMAVGLSAEATEANTLVLGSPAAGAAVIQSIRPTKTDAFAVVKLDLGGFIPVNKATVVAVTLPLDAAIPWPVGGRTELGQVGLGVVSCPGGGGVTVLGITATAGAGQVLILRKIDTDTWYGSL